jgi:glycosyltransferase involved in cell wall biosynthesis
MKILISAFTFPPYKDGVSEAAAVMADGFLRRGWELDLATSPPKPSRQSTDWRGASIHEFDIQGSGNANYPFAGDIEKYREFLLKGNWDVIIFHAYGWPILVPVDILERIKSRKILVSHGYAALQWLRAPKFPWGLAVWVWSVKESLRMTKWIRSIDRAVYLSERADFRGFFDHWLAKATGYEGRTVIANGIDPEEHGTNPEAFRRKHDISSDHFLFLCVANYSRRKDQGFAARAFRKARLPNAVMLFIGSEFNSESDRFIKQDESLAESDKVGTIIWLEGQSREETLNAFAACDAFVLSADHEAQPIVLLEAMRESKPWIARDAGCIADMPGGICVKNESQMAHTMKHLTCHSKQARDLGTVGRKAIKNYYNRSAYVERYCSLVNELKEQIK